MKLSRQSALTILVICASSLGGGFLASRLLPPLLAATYKQVGVEPDYALGPFPVFSTFVFGAVIGGLAGLWLVTFVTGVANRWETMTAADKATIFAGVLVGVAISIPFHMLFFAFGPLYLGVSFLLMFVLVAISTGMLRGMQEALPWSGRTARTSSIKIFDTNVIIDGRIGEVVRTGFLDGKIYIPQFVINELQRVADSADANKRQRGRRGLDMLKILRADHDVEIGTLDHLAPDNGSVDERLVALARALHAKLVTNDFNLNKVAQVHGVPVLNVNDLALSLRPVFLPGDTCEVVVERAGSQPGQGVGFLEDGTMVVIEQAADLIGSKVEAKVTQIHQSAAGRMIFAQFEGVLSRDDH